MEETTIEPLVNVKGDKEYNNFVFKEKRAKGPDGKYFVQHTGIPKEKFIVVKKATNGSFPLEGKRIDSQYGVSYIFLIEHNGVQGTMFIKEKYAESYRDCGGDEDLVKIWVTEESFVNDKTGMKVVYDKVNYEAYQA